jgi:hypothetical protein
MSDQIGDPCETCGKPIVWVDYGDDNGSLCLHCYRNDDVIDGPYRSWNSMVKNMFKESVNILMNEKLTDVEWKYAQNCIHSGLKYIESRRMDEELTPKRPARNFNEFMLQFINYLDTFRNQIVLEDCEKFEGRATNESTQLVIAVNQLESQVKSFMITRGMKIEDVRPS